MRVADVGETGLIEMLRPFAADAAARLLDDCAVLEVGGVNLAVTTDAHAQGVHFDTERMSFLDIGYRALAACLSDLAAAGADGPPSYLVALGVPGELQAADVAEVYRGMAEMALRTGAQMIGGDTIQSDRLFLSLTAMAAVRNPLSRRRAQVGDRVFVSGVPGCAARDLRRLLSGEAGDAQLLSFLRPMPRLQLGQALARAGASACADISDGLASELRAIARASSVGIFVDEDRLPEVAEVPRADGIDLAYRGGEDFELVFTAPPNVRETILGLSSEHGRITEIGEVTGEARTVRAVRGGRPSAVPKSGYAHHGGGGA